MVDHAGEPDILGQMLSCTTCKRSNIVVKVSCHTEDLNHGQDDFWQQHDLWEENGLRQRDFRKLHGFSQNAAF